MEVLIQNFSYITVPMLVMWGIGGVLIYLAIVKEMEPTLLLPMDFGAILVNLPVAVHRHRRHDRFYTLADKGYIPIRSEFRFR